MPICRHCHKSFELKNHNAVGRKYCYRPECKEKEKVRIKQVQKDWWKKNPKTYYKTGQKEERRSYKQRDKTEGKQKACPDCGEMTPNYYRCDKCWKKYENCGLCDDDWNYAITPDDRKEEYDERW